MVFRCICFQIIIIKATENLFCSKLLQIIILFLSDYHIVDHIRTESCCQQNLQYRKWSLQKTNDKYLHSNNEGPSMDPCETP